MPPTLPQHSQSPKASPQPKPAHLAPQAPDNSPSQLSSTAPTPSPNPDLPPKPFAPLFTLLTSHPAPLSPHSTTTTTTHHPTIHYLFSDDSSDLLTSAALSTLEPLPSPSPSPPTASASPTQTQEHFLVIDLDSSGTKVNSAQSMSPHWAITAADISAAPTWGEELDESEAGDGKRGLMLKIEGVEARREEGQGKEGGEVGDRDTTVEELEGLAESFQRGLEGLRRVVEVGARWEDGVGNE